MNINGAFHRVIVPSNKNKKMKKKKRSRIESTRTRSYKDIVNRNLKTLREKRGLIRKVIKKNHNGKNKKKKKISKRKEKGKKVLANKKKATKTAKGTKKNLIATFKHLTNTSDVAIRNIILKDSFLKKLNEKQQNYVWVMLNKAYQKRNKEIKMVDEGHIAPKDESETSSISSNYDSVESNADDLLKSFLKNISIKTGGVDNGKQRDSGNVNSSDKGKSNNSAADPYSTFNKVIPPPIGHQVSSSHGYPALTNPQGLPIHPNKC